jgi:hypothetical protein
MAKGTGHKAKTAKENLSSSYTLHLAPCTFSVGKAIET